MVLSAIKTKLKGSTEISPLWSVGRPLSISITTIAVYYLYSKYNISNPTSTLVIARRRRGNLSAKEPT